MALPERPEIDELAAHWTAAWTGDGDFARCCSAEVSYEDPLTKEPQLGLAALADHASSLRAALPDARVELTAPVLHRGAHACFAWRLAGTHRGQVALLPATDRFLTLHGLHYVELADNRIARARGFFDLYDGAVQLGLLPTRGGLGEAALMFLRGFGLRR